jgi:broad specificity phosphatase PhoE
LSIRNCNILVLGHLPSADNRKGLRSRDIDFDPEAARLWRDSIIGARPLLRCFGLLVDRTYCPTSLRHAGSARLLTEALGIAEPVEDARLNNVDYGVHKGQPLAETPSGVAALVHPFEGGEAWSHVAERWRSFCSEVLPRHEGKLVLLAGQSAAAPRMLRHICNRIPLEYAISQPVPNIPFFSSRTDFPKENLVWRYSW